MYFTLEPFWVKMTDAILYCIALCLVYNHFFINHHFVFKEALENNMMSTTFESSAHKTVEIDSLQWHITPEQTN